MSITVSQSGIDVLLELAGLYIDEISNDKNPPQIVFDSLRDYLNNQTQASFENCRKCFIEHLNRTEPLQQIKNIVELPDIVDSNDLSEHRLIDDENQRKKSRPWTPEEDKRLYSGILRYGTDNWNLVSEFVGNGRSRAQCSQRYSRGLNPRISKNSWTHEENIKLISLVQSYGDKSWTRIAARMGTRSDVQCRYHYAHLQRDLPILFLESNKFMIKNNNTLPMFLPQAGARRYNTRYSVPDLSRFVHIPNKNEEQPSELAQNMLQFPPMQVPAEQNPVLQHNHLVQQPKVKKQHPLFPTGIAFYPKKLIPSIANMSMMNRRTSVPVTPIGIGENSLEGFLSNFN